MDAGDAGEKKLRRRMKIPVFHDDQHGTAIVTAGEVLNALKIGVNMAALATADADAKRTNQLWPVD